MNSSQFEQIAMQSLVHLLNEARAGLEPPAALIKPQTGRYWRLGEIQSRRQLPNAVLRIS